MPEETNDTHAGRQLAAQLDEFLFDTRKKFGMFGQTGWGVRDVTSEAITVWVSPWPARGGAEVVAVRIRDAMRDLLRDMVPCLRFRAVFGASAREERSAAAERIIDLDFFPGSGGASRSPAILIEQHAEPYRREWRPRLHEMWQAVLAEGRAPGGRT